MTEGKLKLSDRLYWLRWNILAFILQTACAPFFALYMWARMASVLFITDGSETIGFPWETDWSWDL